MADDIRHALKQYYGVTVKPGRRYNCMGILICSEGSAPSPQTLSDEVVMLGLIPFDHGQLEMTRLGIDLDEIGNFFRCRS